VSDQWHCSEVTVDKGLTSAAEVVIDDGTVTPQNIDICYSIIISRSSVVSSFFGGVGERTVLQNCQLLTYIATSCRMIDE
jgi:hypothetical protein